MIKDSHQIGLEWEAANPARATELNDLMDACASMDKKRELYKTFTKDEQRGLMPEYIRRRENERAPNGSLVRGRHHDKVNGHTFSFWVRSGDGRSLMSGCHLGLATVIGQNGYGGHMRYVLLQPPWQNKEGTIVAFAEAQSCDLEVLE